MESYNRGALSPLAISWHKGSSCSVVVSWYDSHIKSARFTWLHIFGEDAMNIENHENSPKKREKSSSFRLCVKIRNAQRIPFSPPARATEPNNYGAGRENHFHHMSMAWAGAENGPLYKPSPSSSYPSSPFLPTIFSVISHHGIQNFRSLLKYWYQGLGLRLVTSNH